MSTSATTFRLERAEALVDAALAATEAGLSRATALEVATVASAAAAVVEARIAHDRRSLGTDPRAPIFTTANRRA